MHVGILACTQHQKFIYHELDVICTGMHIHTYIHTYIHTAKPYEGYCLYTSVNRTLNFAKGKFVMWRQVCVFTQPSAL